MSVIHTIAIIAPAPGKRERTKELLANLSKEVHANEEGETIRYILTEQSGVEEPDLIMIEAYASKDAAEKHGKTSYFKKFFEAVGAESLVSKPPQIIHAAPVAGFDLDHKFFGKL